jgi:hypothetical protein
MTPVGHLYGVAQLEAKVGAAGGYVLFARGAYGEEYSQFDAGFGLRF